MVSWLARDPKTGVTWLIQQGDKGNPVLAVDKEGRVLRSFGKAFNAFNRTNWNNPGVNNAGSSTFGQITGSLPARVLQFGGKINF